MFTPAEKARIAHRRKQAKRALELKRQGLSIRAIAQKMGYKNHNSVVILLKYVSYK